MIKFSALTFLYITFCLITAQSQKLPNTLLWRISGNGLQKPSYLYGTMHLTDSRLFNLGDSLYNAIENTEGFAIEVNPEEMVPFIIAEVTRQIKDATLIKNVLNEKEFKIYSSALSKKLKKPADKITTRDIFIEKNKWVQESFRKGEMSTFLDAYLFDIARRQGKWTGGIEDMGDQKGLMNELIDESDIRQIANGEEDDMNGKADSFIKLYLNGNLNSIDSISNSYDSGYTDKILIKRNIKMARRMDSLNKIRNMVFAVGAAHLPGKEGLINLLQKEGYDVQPVFSSKKIKPAEYKIKETIIPWITVNDPDSFYKVNMPDKPGDIDMYGVLKMKMDFDIFNSTGYMVTAITTPYDQKRIDSMLNFFAVSIFKQKNPEKAKKITINGISGRELEGTDKDGYKHGYILYKYPIIYIAMGFAVKKNMKSDKDLDKFLSSYQVFEKKQNDKPVVYTYTDSARLFTIDLPSKPQSGNDLISSAAKDASIKSHLMVNFDNQTGAYYFFGVNRAAPGYFIEDDSTAFSNIEKDVKAKFSAVTFDSIYRGDKNRIFKIEGLMTKANIFTRAYYELRGNRWYALLVMYDTSKPNPGVGRFFSSFKIFDSSPANWKQQSSEDGAITAWVPDNINYALSDSGDYSYSKKYGAYDSSLGNNYDVIVSGLGKYFWQKSDSAFWSAIQKTYISYNDTVLSQRSVTNGNIKGIELQLRQNTSLNVKRKRVLLYGDSIYVLITVQPEQDINNININKFFDDFRFNQPPPPSAVFISKAIQLVNDLSDKDSVIRAGARQALGNANFEVSDLPLLYEALLKKYTGDSDYYKTMNDEMARVIINIKDSSSLKVAKEKYLLVTDKKIRDLLLDIISEYKTKENFADLKNLLLRSHPDTAVSYSFISNITDSLPLAADLFPGILPFLKDTLTAPALINISDV
ncbi:MAG: TraB/GumN family protein, partial [Ginsengibacter sp.]